MEDAGRDMVDDELLAVSIDGVAGVVSPLVAGDDVKVFRQEVDDLTLALVPPLKSHDGDVQGRPPPSNQ
jgi:hypothetical protein